MKKRIKDFMTLVSFILGFAGFIICCFESETIENQITTFIIGFSVIGLGVLIHWLTGFIEEGEGFVR